MSNNVFIKFEGIYNRGVFGPVQQKEARSYFRNRMWSTFECGKVNHFRVDQALNYDCIDDFPHDNTHSMLNNLPGTPVYTLG